MGLSVDFVSPHDTRARALEDRAITSPLTVTTGGGLETNTISGEAEEALLELKQEAVTLITQGQFSSASPYIAAYLRVHSAEESPEELQAGLVTEVLDRVVNQFLDEHTLPSKDEKIEPLYKPIDRFILEVDLDKPDTKPKALISLTRIQPDDRFFTFGGAPGVSGKYIIEVANRSDLKDILMAAAFENLKLASRGSPVISDKKKSAPVTNDLPTIRFDDSPERLACSGLNPMEEVSELRKILESKKQKN